MSDAHKMVEDPIPAAVLAERERCALICETAADEAVEKWGAEDGVPVAVAARACAAAIRG